MRLLDRLSDRALAFLTAGVFAALGLDLLIIDVVPFLDEALLATAATGLATGLLKRRRERKAKRLAVEAEEQAEAAAAARAAADAGSFP